MYYYFITVETILFFSEIELSYRRIYQWIITMTWLENAVNDIYAINYFFRNFLDYLVCR